jgi:signal transduction histidine kinase
MFAQNSDTKIIDSLKLELRKSKIDTAKVNLLNELSRNNFYSDPMEGMRYGEIALNLASKIQWKKGMAIANDHIGICYWVTANHPKSILYFQNSLSNYQDLKDQAGTANAYNHLASLHLGIKKYKQAFVYFNEAYKIDRLTSNKTQMANDLTGIADVFFKLNNYTKAIEFYLKAKELYFTVDNFYGVGVSYINIGKAYSSKKEYSDGLVNYNKALDNLNKIEGTKYDIGNAYLEMGKAYYNLALEDKRTKTKNLNLSLKYSNKAINTFTEIKTFDKINDCNLELYKTYKETGNYKLALEYFEKHLKIKETFLNYENNIKLGELKTKREFELRDKKIEIQNLQIKSETSKVYLLITITIATLILLTLFLWLYLSKRSNNKLLSQKNKEISNANKQKDRFFSIIAHDLRGPFSGFLGLTELLASEIDTMDKEEIQFSAAIMASSAKNLENLLESLLEWSCMEQGLIPFTPQEINLYQTTMECILISQTAAEKKEIQIQNKIKDDTIVFADNYMLHTIIRNILSNAVKFTQKGGSITIQAEKDSKNTIISITDSGIGMNAKIVENIFKLDVKTNRNGTENEPSSGLGLILCKEFIEKHGGKIRIESGENKGTTFYCSFPFAV